MSAKPIGSFESYLPGGRDAALALARANARRSSQRLDTVRRDLDASQPDLVSSTVVANARIRAWVQESIALSTDPEVVFEAERSVGSSHQHDASFAQGGIHMHRTQAFLRSAGGGRFDAR